MSDPKPVSLRYMGSKTKMAPKLAEHVRHFSGDKFIDFFCGTSTLSSRLCDTHKVTQNDASQFAACLAYDQFCCTPISFIDATGIVKKAHKIAEQLYIGLENVLDEEDAALEDCDKALSFFSKNKTAGFYYARYAPSYFSLRQTVQIQAISDLADKLETWDQQNAVRVALAIACMAATTSPGHFAQPITPKPSNINSYLKYRRKDIIDLFYEATIRERPTVKHANKNEAIISDATEIAKKFNRMGRTYDIAFADPPYSKDQYSRFYGFLDTILQNDCPSVTGKGLARTGRFRSEFSRSSLARSSMKDLISEVSQCSKAFILTYPTMGLIPNSKEYILKILESFYPHYEIIEEVPLKHSTLGGYHGSATVIAKELVFAAWH